LYLIFILNPNLSFEIDTIHEMVRILFHNVKTESNDQQIIIYLSKNDCRIVWELRWIVPIFGKQN
jgi:hypothetical protein